jgi:prepilin-type N-terminal cleavage/methylation domain-containing protein
MQKTPRHPSPQHPEAGFTLMEMLVVLTIFSMVVVAATDIFILSSRSQRKVFGLERVQADARFTMESIVREVRTGMVDREWYASRGAPPGGPDDTLALIDATGTSIVFKESDASDEEYCPDVTSRPCLLVSLDGSVPASITPVGVRVRSLGFYIMPAEDPFAFDVDLGAYPSDVQPFVTIALSLETVEPRVTDRTLVRFQTTATQRAYSR